MVNGPTELPLSRGANSITRYNSPDMFPCNVLTGCLRLNALNLYVSVLSTLKKGQIRPSTSSYAAPVLLFARKADNSFVMCIDYIALNAIPLKDRYTLPRIDDVLTEPSGAQRFCLITWTACKVTTG